MGWEKRQRGGQYYVMKTRFGDRVFSHYVGNGETAQIISQLEAIYRERDEFRRWKEARELRRPAWEEALDAFCADVRAAFRQEMEAGGWYLHRWQWRRGRGASMARAKAQPVQESLIIRAQKDDAACVEILEQWKGWNLLRENLACTYDAFFSYADGRAATNPLLKAAIDHRTDDLRRELATAGDTALEEILIERVIVCFHAMNDAESTFQRLNRTEGVTLTKIEHYDRANDRAQRRYLTAVRELGLARRLRLPKREADEEETRLRLLKCGKPAPLMIEQPKDAA